uniref:hypothetical protein n=1 Tax=Enterocloster clostridioformis TaxID=1531 RepID=UPI0025A619D5|nr:hypothetical protein [Enterocloster clostridioformis]
MDFTAGYGALINGKHTYRDLKLVIGNNDIVQTPAPKVNIIDIPGSSHRLDLTDTLTGRVEYEGRTLTFSFGIRTSRDSWPAVCRQVMLLYHGQKVKVILDTEPEYYYEGRAVIEDFDRVGTLGTFTMKVDADAYKYEIHDSLGNWEWDGFNFETGIVREYADIAVDGSTSLYVYGSDIPMTPVFNITDYSTEKDAYIRFSSKRYNLIAGKNRFAALSIPPSGGRIYFYGKYTASVDVRGGSL